MLNLTESQKLYLMETLAHCQQTTNYFFEQDSKLQAEIEEYAKSKGFHFTVSNGQRRFGPPIAWKGGQPPRGSEVFIARLPRSFNETQLIPILEVIGPIYCFRIMMNFSKCNRGFAFCKFISPELASKAVQYLNGLELQESDLSLESKLRTVKIGVVPSLEKTTLSLYPIPPEVTLSQIDKLLNDIGVEGNCVQFIRKDDEVNPLGVKWLVSFDEHRSAAIARRKLIVQRNIWGTNYHIDYDLSNNANHFNSSNLLSLPLLPASPPTNITTQRIKSIVTKKNRPKGSSKPKTRSFTHQGSRLFMPNQRPLWP